MKTKQLFYKTICSAMFAGAMLLSTSLFAQVKIGTNPTVIGGSSNLEIEASNNKKIISDKATGTLKVENKPLAAMTDSLVTRDANGELHQMSQSRLLSQQIVPVTVFSATLTSPYIIPIYTGNNVSAQAIPLTPRPGYSTGWNSTTNKFTLPSDGFYQVEIGLVCLGTTLTPGTKLGTRIWSSFDNGGAYVLGTQDISSGFGDWQSIVWSGQWTAGSTVNLNGFTFKQPLSSAVDPSTVTGNCIKGYMNITKVR